MGNVKFKPYDKVLVRNDSAEAWQLGLFEMELDGGGAYLCLNRTYRQCIPFNGYEDLLGKTDEPEEDLDIDTPVMCNSGADKRWYLGYYGGDGEVWMHACKITDKIGKCEWYIIVPYDKFNPNDIEGSMRYNIVKHVSKEESDTSYQEHLW